MARRRILGVFAHPDDEVFCAGGRATCRVWVRTWTSPGSPPDRRSSNRVTAEALYVAVESVTCLVFRRRASDLWAGRGSGTSDHPAVLGNDGPSTTGATAIIDVRSVVDRKIAAVAAHRTQYPIEPDMFPRWMLEEMMGYEHIVQVQPAVLPATDLFA